MWAPRTAADVGQGSCGQGASPVAVPPALAAGRAGESEGQPRAAGSWRRGPSGCSTLSNARLRAPRPQGCSAGLAPAGAGLGTGRQGPWQPRHAPAPCMGQPAPLQSTPWHPEKSPALGLSHRCRQEAFLGVRPSNPSLRPPRSVPKTLPLAPSPCERGIRLPSCEPGRRKPPQGSPCHPCGSWKKHHPTMPAGKPLSLWTQWGQPARGLGVGGWG